MKLRIDLSIFLVVVLLFSPKTYNKDHLINLQQNVILKLKESEINLSDYNYNNADKRSVNTRSDSNEYKEEYTLEVYDYTNVTWSFEEGRERGVFFVPGNISKYATKITGFDISNESAVTVEWGYFGLEKSHGIVFHPKNIGITEITIYIENDKGAKGKTTFKIETTPYQRPVPANIERQYINEGQNIRFFYRDLIKNKGEILVKIKEVTSSDPNVAEIYLSHDNIMFDIYGISVGETEITARVYNITEFGKNDIVDIIIPITVTQAVYSN